MILDKIWDNLVKDATTEEPISPECRHLFGLIFGIHKDNYGYNNHDNLCILFDATEIRRLKACRIFVELCDEACRKIRQRRI